MPYYLFSNRTAGRSDTQMVAVMRFVLAFSALLIIFINPSEPDRFVVETYITLNLYVLYSLSVFLLVRFEISFFEPFLKYLHWSDVAWYLLLISLSSGTSSIFFFFFFFVVLYTSFIYGFSEGLKITLFSALSFSVLGYLTSPSGQQFEFDRFFLRPVYLVVLGYMMAYWGGYEIRAKRRLALLRDIVALSNPRFGVDRTTGTIVELLRSFYDADGCLLILADSEPDRFVVRLAERNDPENALRAQSVNLKVAQNLISLPEDYAAVFEKSDRPAFRVFRRFYVSEVPDKYNIKANREIFERIAEKLDTRSFLTVPVFFRKQAVGRVFIFSKTFKVFDPTDIDFLLQAINQFMPIVENIRLVDHLASGAAEEERKKIARDIHDSVIQPYIGLRLGIESVISLLETGSANQTDAARKAETIKTRINRLKDLTDKGIEDLRGYTSSLSQRRGFETKLLPSIRGFAEKFANATGISVEIKAADNIQINERLAAEVFQIVAEGLSNIRRHTDSPTARIEIAADKDKLVLAIENEFIDNGSINFTPKSISGRAGSLGGSIDVRQVDQKTVIRVEIPL